MGRTHGVFGLPLTATRLLARASVILGAVLLFFAPSKPPIFSFDFFLTKEFGYILFGTGLVLLVGYE
ncbi:MAG: hypothetical protein HY393_02380 [Candidatus Diapherotrites archaeon]|nr:hypothetical protein [Candidatus Diapherotrites archaeon]